MKKSLIALLLVILLFGGCAPAPASLTPPPTATATQTKTPHPTQTAIPTATPYPPLQTDGPYLLFTHDNKNFTIMDADGSGQKQFQLPNDGYVHDLNSAVSPDGKWLVYFTGSKDEPHDLTLNLLNLSNGSSQIISHLIASNFPENLEPVTETVQVFESDTDCFSNMSCKIGLVESAFKSSIENFAWSPNSQEIAFAAQIDGPSSDIYIYKLADSSIRRLTNDLENIYSIEWTPSAEKILYLNSLPGRIYTSRTLKIADPKSKSVQNPKSIYEGAFWRKHGWINENSYLISSGGEGASDQYFQYINVETQQFKTIWPYTAEYIVIDRTNEKIALTTIPSGYLDNEPKEGTYTLSIDGNYSKITNDLFVLYEAFRESQVLGWRNDQIYSISLDGNITLIGPSEWDQHQRPIASPNQKWILLLENKSKITLYLVDTYKQIKAWNIDEYIYRISWRPDSLGIFLSTETHIYYLPIQNGEPILLDNCPPNNFCGYKDFVWLP